MRLTLPAGWRGGAALAGLVVVAAVVRLEGQGFPLWSDEGLSVGIASHPLAEIPTVLRRDGSPPLYYAVLHLWMRWWGSSAVAVRSLSLLVSLAAIPLAFWAGASLFGRRVGWMAAVLAATSTYLTLYSREARMYALVAVLALASAASFAHVFVLGRRRWLPAFVVSSALLVLAHNWGLFLVLGAAVAAWWCT
ncbi:MAG: glycosyltransferase family 39 protein, partial [Actinomycetota bacterium]|nr:glycosyltransferase family 39 protein [Actinomycetota bacterium]